MPDSTFGTYAAKTQLSMLLARAEAGEEITITRRGKPVGPDHRDPFDRMLIAQARHEGLTLMTSDAKLATYGVPTLGCA